MKINVAIDFKTITKEALFDAYQLKMVRSYCAQCNNHHKNYSCPPHAPNGAVYLRDHKYITLIRTRVDTHKLSQNFGALCTKTYRSETLTSYANNDIDKYAEVSMYSFDVTKEKIASKLLALENNFIALSIPPGKCSLCTTCAVKHRKCCAHPKKLRYSLESMGFLVSKLMERHYKAKLEWAENTFPPYFMTLSGLASQRPINHEDLFKQLGEIKITY